jgi:hypothetical protein
MQSSADTVVLLRTWNRPKLLRQALPQIMRETKQIGAQLVVSDDRSSDQETVGLLSQARKAGADVIFSPDAREHSPLLDRVIHAAPRDAVRTLATSPEGASLIRRCAHQGRGSAPVRRGLLELWNQQLSSAHVSAQKNFLFALRHIVDRYPRTGWVLSVDDDVVMQLGAFGQMFETWKLAERKEKDVLAVSGIRTVNEAAVVRRQRYTITAGICSVAVLKRRSDWESFLTLIPESQAIRRGCDLAFAWDYAPVHRPGAVAVSVTPSVVYHTGQNGLHVRNVDLNCEYGGDTNNVFVG